MLHAAKAAIAVGLAALNAVAILLRDWESEVKQRAADTAAMETLALLMSELEERGFRSSR